MVDLHENTRQSQEIAWTYKSFEDLDWMYMPLDKDEHVEDIWFVRSKRHRRRGLLVRCLQNAESLVTQYPVLTLLTIVCNQYWACKYVWQDARFP